MKYFKNEQNEVFAFEADGSQDAFISEGLVAITEAEADAIRYPAPTAEQIIAQYTAAIQKRLDVFARTRGYDDCLSCCTYATSQVPKFAAEGQYMVNARDTTWATAYAIMADVQTGTRPMPTLEELIAELGALAWPA